MNGGHYLARDLGDDVVSDTDFHSGDGDSLVSAPQTWKLQGNDTEKMLGDFQFVIGDYICWIG